MQRKRLLFLLSAVIALVAVAAFAVLWIGARTQLARGVVAGWISEAAGLPATVEELRIGFLPRPSVDMGGIAIAQPPGFSGKPMLEIGRLRLSLPWRSVFGVTRLEAVEISEATARLVVRADGESNWSKLFAEPVPATGTPEEASPEWFIGSFDLERGTIDYRDESANSSWQLAAITVVASDLAPEKDFPLELRLGGIFGPNTINYAMKGTGKLDLEAGRIDGSSLDFRGWVGGDPLPLAGIELKGALKQATYEMGNGLATLDTGKFNLAGIPGTFDGMLDFDEPELIAALRMATEPFAPRAPAVSLGHPLPLTKDPAAFEMLQVALVAEMDGEGLRLDPVTGQLDDTHFEGRIEPDKRLVRANFDSIDLNRYVGPEVKGVRKTKATLEAFVAQIAKFDVDAEIRIDEAHGRRGQIAGYRRPRRAKRRARAMSMVPSALADTLLLWFEAHGRRDLPWQSNPTPYRVWVSEVMLQQTQVETVKPYFERFIARFPDAASLASAPQDEVMRLWSGLGYYARARNLQRGAQEIVARHGGRLPETLDGLMALPGIGRSTAGAILALAHGQRHPILDGNVKRVLARVFQVEEAPDTAAGARKLWALALDCTPPARVAEYTQAIMDLGATVCTRTNPACTSCPLAIGCGALAAGRVGEIPVARRRAPRRLRQTHMVFALSEGRVMLERRPPRGIWGGLWAPPEFPDAGAAEAFAASRFGPAIAATRRLPPVRHVFTHFDLDIEPWLLELQGLDGEVAEGESRWHELASIDAVGLPAPVARLLEELRNGPNGSVHQARPRSGRPRPVAVSG